MSGGGQQRIRGLIHASAGAQWSFKIFPVVFSPFISRGPISLSLSPHQSSADSLPAASERPMSHALVRNMRGAVDDKNLSRSPGLPRFIAYHFAHHCIVPPRCCFSCKLKARHSTSKNTMTCFSVILTLLQWSGTDP